MWPDEETFRCLAACKKAIKKGGLGPCAANGANEEAVKLFLEDKIGFLDIGRLVEAVVDSDSFGGDYTLSDVYECDRMARHSCRKRTCKAIYALALFLEFPGRYMGELYYLRCRAARVQCGDRHPRVRALLLWQSSAAFRSMSFPSADGAGALEKDHKGTQYSLRALPVGGFVALEGEESPESQQAEAARDRRRSGARGRGAPEGSHRHPLERGAGLAAGTGHGSRCCHELRAGLCGAGGF